MRSTSAPFSLSELFECRVTTTVLVASITLSILRLNGSDMNALIADPDTWMTRPWTLVTTTLLHVNFLHLVFNVYWIAIFGMAVESAFGLLPTAGFMLLFAVVSTAPEVAVADGGIGLSGVAYALFGFLWTLSRWDTRYRGCLEPRTTALFVGWFFFCILLTVTGTMPIANIAHGAGALVGAATGWAVADTSKTVAARFWPLFSLLVAIVMACEFLPPHLLGESSHTSKMARDGQLAMQAGDQAGAELLFASAVEKDADDWNSWWSLGEARWHQAKYERALDAFGKAAALHSLPPEQWDFLVKARDWYRQNGRASSERNRSSSK